MELTDASKDLYTNTRTKELQDFYGIKYEELWDEDRLEELWVTPDEIKEIVEIRGKELAYKDTVGFELWEWVMESERFKKIKEHYGVTIEDTQDAKKLEAKWVPQADIEFITGKRIKSKKKSNASKDTKGNGTPEKRSKAAK